MLRPIPVEACPERCRRVDDGLEAADMGAAQTPLQAALGPFGFFPDEQVLNPAAAGKFMPGVDLFVRYKTKPYKPIIVLS